MTEKVDATAAGGFAAFSCLAVLPAASEVTLSRTYHSILRIIYSMLAMLLTTMVTHTLASVASFCRATSKI